MKDAPSRESEGLVTVLWFDEHLVVANKPAGLPTLPDGYDPNAPYLRLLLEPQFGHLWIVPRLDRGTSGAIVLARSAEAHRALNLQFDAHEVRKVYHAITVGEPSWEEQTVDLPLRADGDRKHRTVIDARRGKPATTHFRLIERLDGYALIEARPETGRTHQIRAHLANIGLPLLGDALYTSKGAAPGSDGLAVLDRPALHAAALAFAHPTTGAALSFEASYPADFEGALHHLRDRLSQKPRGNP